MRLDKEARDGLQAKVKALEQEIAELKAKQAKEEAVETAEALEAKEAELETARGQLEKDRLEARNEELESAVLEGRTKDAKAAVKAAVKRGALPAQDEALQATWEKKCTEDPDNIELLAKMRGSAALERPRLTLNRVKIEREDSVSVLNAYAREQDPKKRGIIYATEIAKRLAEGDPLPLHATNTPGTLAGTLVSQRTLELLKFTFPVLDSITTDFSGEPLYAQTLTTRTIGIPDVQDYNTTTGWTDSSTADTDVTVVMNKHQGVPITYNAQDLASTVRRLFDEHAPAAAYALTKSMVDGLYALFLAANYTATPIVAAPIDFGRGSLVDIGVALDDAGVPDMPNDRFILLSSTYYGQLKKDSTIIALGTQQQAGLITGNVLPDVDGFRVIKAPNMPTTANLRGFAGTRSSLVIATRLDSDYTAIFPGAAAGNMTVVQDPSTQIALRQVQYVDHKLGTATQRVSLMWGVAKGQVAAGRLLKAA